MTPTPLTPSSPVAPSVWKQNRRLIVIIIAAVVTGLAAAYLAFGLVSYDRRSDTQADQRLVDLLEAGNTIDRALYTELSNRQANTTGAIINEDFLNTAADGLATALDQFGLGNLNLSDSEADQQTRLLLEDPAGRVQAARIELTTGTPAGTELPATFDTLREAVHNLAVKASDIFSNQDLRPTAEVFAGVMDPRTNIPPRSDVEVPPDDPRTAALEVLRADSAVKADDAMGGPPVLWTIGGVCGVIGIALWVLLAIKWKSWAREPRPAGRAATVRARVSAATKPTPELPATKSQVDHAAAPVPASPAVAAAAAAPPVSGPAGAKAKPATSSGGQPSGPAVAEIGAGGGQATAGRSGQDTPAKTTPPRKPRVPFAPTTARSPSTPAAASSPAAASAASAASAGTAPATSATGAGASAVAPGPVTSSAATSSAATPSPVTAGQAAPAQFTPGGPAPTPAASGPAAPAGVPNGTPPAQAPTPGTGPKPPAAGQPPTSGTPGQASPSAPKKPGPRVPWRAAPDK